MAIAKKITTAKKATASKPRAKAATKKTTTKRKLNGSQAKRATGGGIGTNSPFDLGG